MGQYDLDLAIGLFIYFTLKTFIDFWLHWVSAVVHGLRIAMASLFASAGFRMHQLQQLQGVGSVVVAYEP